jgi:hypothetical protein
MSRTGLQGLIGWLILGLVFCPTPSKAALGAATVFEVRGTGGIGPGSDSNGGGANAATVATLFSGTDLAVDASLNTKVSSAGHNFVAADVGTQIKITAGTGWTVGSYHVVSVAANAATLDRSPAPVSTTAGTWAEIADFTQSNMPILSVADAVTTGTTTVTSVTGGFTTAMVGNDINLVGDNIYEITARASSNSITVDRATGTSAAQTANVGGALGGSAVNSGLAKLAATMVASNKAFVTGAFTSNATITFAAGATPNGTNAQTRVIGYGAARGDTGHATLALQTNTGLIGINSTALGFWLEQVDIDCGSLGTSTGVALTSNYGRVFNCKVANFTLRGLYLPVTYDLVYQCEVTGGTSAATAAVNLMNSPSKCSACFIHDNACPGIVLSDAITASWNLVVNNSGAASDGIRCGDNCKISNNTIHNNGRHGISHTGVSELGSEWLNNVISSNGGFGILGTAGTALPAALLYDGNAYYNNTSGTRSLMDSTTGIYGVNAYVNTRDVILSASPYVGPTTGSAANFALNNTAGGGAAIRGKGSPGTWPGNTGSTGFLDMGAVQSAGTAKKRIEIIH